MGMPKGSKIAANPKEILYQVRVDQNTDNKCKAVMDYFKMSKSDVIRKGIELQYQEVEHENN